MLKSKILIKPREEEAHTMLEHAVKKGRLLYRHRNPAGILTVAWSPDGRSLATGDAASCIRVRQADTGQELLVSRVHTHSITTLAWSPEGTHLASGDLNGLITVWEVLTGKTRYTFHSSNRTEEEGDYSAKVAWSPDGRFLACRGWWDDRMTIQLREAETGEQLMRWRAREGVATLQWSPQGKYLTSGDSSGAVHLWDSLTGQRVATYQTSSVTNVSPLVYVNHIAWSPDGRRIAFGDTLGIVQAWDVVDTRPLAIFSPGRRPIGKIKPWDPDGIIGVRWLPEEGQLAAACRQVVQVRHATTGRRLVTYQDPFAGEEGYVLYQVDWSPDRKHMVSVGGYFVSNEPDPVVYEGCMYVWEVEE
jgi:eukaryotic-like serine/threonine-protein kinase